MNTEWIYLTLIPLLVAFGACMKVSDWHSSEADYWRHVALLVRLNPALDAVHRPVLEWVQANRPSLWKRLAPWRPPPKRMTTETGETDE